MLNTWPAFTEAMHLLGCAGGAAGQQARWRLQQSRRLDIAEPSKFALERSAALMDRYADLPMDLADATLVLDSDFRVYRIHGRTHFDIVPS